MPQPLHESRPLSEATAADAGAADGGRMLIQVLTPGWGSSGYYSPEVVEAAAPLVAVGTQMYLDHPTDRENQERPVRSVRDIAAVVTEAGRWDETLQAVVAEARVVAPYRDLMADQDFVNAIGLSIRGSATDIVVGEAEGRRGPIVEGLHDIASVDFVTRAGRGGRVLQLLEDAGPRPTQRAVARGVAEATADERREQLSNVVRSTYGGDDRYAWVRDFDDDVVWFETHADDETSHTWQQAYTVADDDLSVTLTGERVEVRSVTRYVPVTRPGSTTTEESEEDTMPNIQIDEAEHTRLVETAGRVDAAEQRATTAEAALAARDRRDRATEIVADRAGEAGVEFTSLERRGLLADLPLTESGDLDESTFTTTVDEAASEVAARGTTTSGGVRGFGETASGGTSGSTVTESAPTRTPWGRKIEKGA